MDVYTKMATTRLVLFNSTIRNINNVGGYSRSSSRIQQRTPCRYIHQKLVDEINNSDKPLKYVNSPAAKNMYMVIVPAIRDIPKIEPWSAFFSLAIFLIYFGMLREENDWDHQLYEPLILEEEEEEEEDEEVEVKEDRIKEYVVIHKDKDKVNNQKSK